MFPQQTRIDAIRLEKEILMRVKHFCFADLFKKSSVI